MVQKEMCVSSVPVCNGKSIPIVDKKYIFKNICSGEASNYVTAPEDWEEDDTCATTEWTIWSPCSVKCGAKEGYKIRIRRFFHRRGRKKCPHIDTVERESCTAVKVTINNSKQ